MKTARCADPLRRRCRQALDNHRRRAKADGVAIAYHVEDLEQLARACSCCHWCGRPLALDFHFDHRTPTARGGRHTLDNLALSCGRCNRLKGQLDGAEMRALLRLLRSLSPAASADLARRLLAGGRCYRGGWPG